jgi:SulP family sulfate permease
MARGAPVLFGSLAGYRRRWPRRDLVAGLTVWAVLVPESLAYATIAGVSPVVGLYAAVPALVLYAALGSSRHLVAVRCRRLRHCRPASWAPSSPPAATGTPG